MRMIWFAVASACALGGCVHVTVHDDGRQAAAPSGDVCAGATGGGAPITSTPVGSRATDAPGKTLTAVRLDVPPHAKANPHRHPGLTFVYVLEGTVCSQVTGDTALKAYVAGDAFFEPPGSQHLGFANPTDRPAKVLVTFVADTGAALNMPIQ